MAVNRSKEAAGSPEWAKWDAAKAIGTINSAMLRLRRTTTIPAQIAEGPMIERHLGSTVVGDPPQASVWVSTVELGQPEGFRTPRVFETMIFASLPIANKGLETVSDPTGLLKPYIERRSTSSSAALRQHARAVNAAAVVYGTPRA